MDFKPNDREIALEAGDERPDIGRGWRLHMVQYKREAHPTPEEVEVVLEYAGKVFILTYFPVENKFRMDRGMDWFLSEGGEQRFLRSTIRGWLEKAKRRRMTDGEPRRNRPSPKARAAHVQAR